MAPSPVAQTVPEQVLANSSGVNSSLGVNSSGRQPSSFIASPLPSLDENPDTDDKWPAIVRSLRNPDFRLFWSGNFLSNIGTWMQNIAQGWLVLQLSNSSFWLGMVGFAASLPFLMFTLYGGVVADRVNKRYLLLATQSIMMVLAFTMSALTHWHIITIASLAALAFANGVAQSLNAPSYQAMVPQLVRRSDLNNAIALNSAQFHLSRVLGPTLGGFAMAAFGIAGNFFLNGLSFLAVIFAIFRMSPTKETVRRKESMWTSLRAGLRYVHADKSMWAMIVLAITISILVMPFLTFIPWFAKNALHTTESGLGVLMACSGLGAFVGALAMAHAGKQRNRGRWIVTNGLIAMAGLIVFCYSTSYLLSCLCMGVEGFFIISMIAPINVVMQELSSDEMRGRVMSVNATAFMGFPPVGNLLAGELSRHMPLAHAVAGMIATAMVCFLGYLFFSKPLRELD
jgi:predicted MFS family arabinose efflux permease